MWSGLFGALLLWIPSRLRTYRVPSEKKGSGLRSVIESDFFRGRTDV